MYNEVDKKIMSQMPKFRIDDLRNNNDDIINLEIANVNILCGVSTVENTSSCKFQYYMQILDGMFISVGKSFKINYPNSKNLVDNIENDILKNLDRLAIRYMNLTTTTENDIDEKMFFIGSVIDSGRKFSV